MVLIVNAITAPAIMSIKQRLSTHATSIEIVPGHNPVIWKGIKNIPGLKMLKTAHIQTSEPTGTDCAVELASCITVEERRWPLVPSHVEFWPTACSRLQRADGGPGECARSFLALRDSFLAGNKGASPRHLSITATSLGATQSQLNHRSTNGVSFVTRRQREQTWQPRGRDVWLRQGTVTNI